MAAEAPQKRRCSTKKNNRNPASASPPGATRLPKRAYEIVVARGAATATTSTIGSRRSARPACLTIDETREERSMRAGSTEREADNLRAHLGRDHGGGMASTRP